MPNEIANTSEVNEDTLETLPVVEEEEKPVEGTEGENLENQPDYKADFEKAVEARKKAERVLAEQAYKKRQQKKEVYTEPDLDNEDDEKPITKKDLSELLLAERQQTEKLLQKNRIEETLKGLTTNPDEANLIREIHQSRVFPSHLSIEEQVQEAFVIANSKRILAQRNEALRALKSKSVVNNDVAGQYQENKERPEQRLKPDVEFVLKGQGFKYNPQARQWEKAVGTKTLVADKKGNISVK
jgi:hypothetical protein